MPRWRRIFPGMIWQSEPVRGESLQDSWRFGPEPTSDPADDRIHRMTHFHSKGLIEGVASNSCTGFGLIDRASRCVWANDTFVRLAGRPGAEVIGLTVYAIFPTVQGRLEQVLPAVLDWGEAYVNLDVSAGSVREDPTTLHWAITLYPVRDRARIVGAGMFISDVTERRRFDGEMDAMFKATVAALAATVESRDAYTAGHQDRVGRLAAIMASELGLDAFDVAGIRLAASIHDIGKVAVPLDFLVRAGPLRPTELALVREHPQIGSAIVEKLNLRWPVAQMIRQHHERIDGSGYPDGIRGEDTLLGARIIAVADTLEAVASYRPYHPALGVERAIIELQRERGRTLDPDVVDVCVNLWRQARIDSDLQVWDPDGR